MNSVEATDSEAIVFVCHDCDALQQVAGVDPGNEALCVRCGSRLFRNPKGGIDRPLALIISSMILFVIANLYPIMTLKIAGIVQTTTITDAALIFLQRGSPEVAAIVWLPSVLFPGLIILGLFYILFSIRFQLNLPFTRPILKLLTQLTPWGMMDVFFLGVLVALVKLVALADIVLDFGFYAFLLLILLYAATLSSLDSHTLWEALKRSSTDSSEAVHGQEVTHG
jgi:paraquat-inducible protein A